jgi:antagonist of KipI
MSLLVRDPGLLSTVQDGGRPGLGALGVPTSGGMDPRALAIANLLLGNAPGAACLEMTIAGPVLELTEPTVIALAGADLGGIAQPGHRLMPGHSYRLDAGATISFPGRAPGVAPAGSRAYLALPGGFDVPHVLGSRSTCLAAGFGGVDGRPLRAGDRLDAMDPHRACPPLLWPVDDWPARRVATQTRLIRVVPGPGGDPSTRSRLEQLVTTTWTVSSDSDRMGVRLEGRQIETLRSGELLSHGVPWGAIQLPPSGLPIVLAVDHQSTGGYPVIAVVASVDRPVVGQRGPGEEVRFELLDLAAARRAFLEDDARFTRLAAQLEEARIVAESVDWAGA